MAAQVTLISLPSPQTVLTVILIAVILLCVGVIIDHVVQHRKDRRDR